MNKSVRLVRAANGDRQFPNWNKSRRFSVVVQKWIAVANKAATRSTGWRSLFVECETTKGVVTDVNIP